MKRKLKNINYCNNCNKIMLSEPCKRTCMRMRKIPPRYSVSGGSHEDDRAFTRSIEKSLRSFELGSDPLSEYELKIHKTFLTDRKRAIGALISKVFYSLYSGLKSIERIGFHSSDDDNFET